MDEAKSNRNNYLWPLTVFSFLMSIFAWFFFLYRDFAGSLFGNIEKSWFNILFFYFLAALALSVIGLIIGIKQRKIGNRLSGILGIIIPIIAIISTIILGFAVELSIILRTT